MSSFICSAKHFNSIEKKLHELIYDNRFYVPYSLREITPQFYDRRKTSVKSAEKELSAIVDTLRELNVLCVSLQYKHHYEGTLDAQIQTELSEVKSKTETKYLTIHGLYNALSCLNYQIEIGHLKELRELTNGEENALTFLRELKIALASDIVSKLPDDKSNTWEVS